MQLNIKTERHQDHHLIFTIVRFGNNTLGPRLRPQNDDFQHVACFYCLDDVSLGQAPIQMWPNHSKDKKDVEKMIVPGGSIVL